MIWITHLMSVCLQLGETNPICGDLGAVIQQDAKPRLQNHTSFWKKQNQSQNHFRFSGMWCGNGNQAFYHVPGSVSFKMAPRGLVTYREEIQVKLYLSCCELQWSPVWKWNKLDSVCKYSLTNTILSVGRNDAGKSSYTTQRNLVSLNIGPEHSNCIWVDQRYSIFCEILQFQNDFHSKMNSGYRGWR